MGEGATSRQADLETVFDLDKGVRIRIPIYKWEIAVPEYDPVNGVPGESLLFDPENKFFYYSYSIQESEHSNEWYRQIRRWTDLESLRQWMLGCFKFVPERMDEAIRLDDVQAGRPAVDDPAPKIDASILSEIVSRSVCDRTDRDANRLIMDEVLRNSDSVKWGQRTWRDFLKANDVRIGRERLAKLVAYRYAKEAYRAGGGSDKRRLGKR